MTASLMNIRLYEDNAGSLAIVTDGDLVYPRIEHAGDTFDVLCEIIDGTAGGDMTPDYDVPARLVPEHAALIAHRKTDGTVELAEYIGVAGHKCLGIKTAQEEAVRFVDEMSEDNIVEFVASEWAKGIGDHIGASDGDLDRVQDDLPGAIEELVSSRRKAIVDAKGSTTMSDWVLCDDETTEDIRKATIAEVAASLEVGHEGTISVDGRSAYAQKRG